MTTTLTGHQLHNTLLDQLEAVGQWWPDAAQATVSAMNAREVLVKLTELRDSLKDHFAVEEEQGLIPDGLTTDPRFEDKESALLHQHARLHEQLNAVIASVPTTSGNPAAWAIAHKHFDAFRQELQTHENSEIELIQAASGDSPGTVD
jgi:hypothetical protein